MNRDAIALVELQDADGSMEREICRLVPLLNGFYGFFVASLLHKLFSLSFISCPLSPGRQANYAAYIDVDF
jgi:hypothetical protein